MSINGKNAPQGYALKKAKIAGRVTGGTWGTTGNCSSIQMAASEPSLKIYINGELGVLKATGNSKYNISPVLSGIIQCDSVKSVSTTDIFDAWLILKQKPGDNSLALTKLTASGWIDKSKILSSGNIGTVMAGAIKDSCCFAGSVTTTTSYIDGQIIYDLPDPAKNINYNEPATIKNIYIKGIKGKQHCTINSNISAAYIQNVSLADLKIDNGRPFGVAAGYINSVKITDNSGTKTWKNLDKATDSIAIGDAKISLY